METIASVFLIILYIYFGIGVLASLPLVKKIIPTFDESMHETPLFFKILTFPGVVVFWLPILLKWKKTQS